MSNFSQIIMATQEESSPEIGEFTISEGSGVVDDVQASWVSWADDSRFDDAHPRNTAAFSEEWFTLYRGALFYS